MDNPGIVMPTMHCYEKHELPAPFGPKGFQWMSERLKAAGYLNPQAGECPETNNYFLRVDDLHVSKNQLKFDVDSNKTLTVDRPVLNVLSGSAGTVVVKGPPGYTVKLQFQGVGVVKQTSFLMPQNGSFIFQFGPCPTGLAIVVPQQYTFFVEGTSVAPVAVSVTFM